MLISRDGRFESVPRQHPACKSGDSSAWLARPGHAAQFIVQAEMSDRNRRQRDVLGMIFVPLSPQSLMQTSDKRRPVIIRPVTCQSAQPRCARTMYLVLVNSAMGTQTLIDMVHD
jgi:hypothetical protein